MLSKSSVVPWATTQSPPAMVTHVPESLLGNHVIRPPGGEFGSYLSLITSPKSAEPRSSRFWTPKSLKPVWDTTRLK